MRAAQRSPWCSVCDPSPCLSSHHPAGSLVHTMAWNDAASILCGIQGNQFTVWYHPGVVLTDKELLPRTLELKDGR